MAVIPAVDSIQVQVLVNNVALKEYNPDDDEIEVKSSDHDQLISRYIEAKNDAEFTVQLATDKKFGQLHKNVDLRFGICVDGKHMTSRMYARKKFLNGRLSTVAGSRYYSFGVPREKPFKFALLKIGK